MDLDNSMDDLPAIIEIIKNTFYIGKPPSQYPTHADVVFQHPFNSQIFLDTSSDNPAEELLERVLKASEQVVEDCERLPNLEPEALILNEDATTYMALPFKVKSHLKDMFLKSQLTVESKPRDIHHSERKSSCASASSVNRGTLTRGTKSRKLSGTGHGSRLPNLRRAREKRTSLDFFNVERKKNSVDTLISIEEASSLGRHTKSASKSLKTSSVVEDKIGTNFILRPPYYNSIRETDQGVEEGEGRRNDPSQGNMSAWSTRENARRKVTGWLHKTNAV